jgi:PTS system nitrogen regulatory IIA component
MRIQEILSPERILSRAGIASKKSALETLSKLMAGSEPSLTYTEIFDCLNARERLGSTGIGNGIAIPHGRFQHIKQPVAAFLQLKSGIDFDAVDQKPVDLLFSLLVPADSTDEHLQILSCLAAMFSDAALINRLRLRSSPEKIYEILTK